MRNLHRPLMMLGLLCLFISGLSSTAWASCSAPANAIEGENCLPGNSSDEWDITNAGDLSIQGFATDISYNAGSTASFKIQTNASAYNLVIYRMGYYSGLGARKIATVQPSAQLPQSQPACITDTTVGFGGSGLEDCGNWAVSATWPIPATAVSGIYFALLTRTDTGGQSHIFFVVRNDTSHSKLLFQTSDTTWQAYNYYGLGSVYGPNSGVNDLNHRSFKVSYNRPFLNRSGVAYNWVFDAEYPMVRWLESNGYDMTYASGMDTDRFGSLLTQHKVFLSVGHDEYWSGNQRANVQAAIAAGVNAAFFSGNEVFWKTRWESSIDGSGTPYRTLVTYKETHANAVIDPKDPPTWTGTWRDPRFSPPADGGRPENALTGTIFMVNGASFNSIQIPAADGKMRFWRNTAVAAQSPGQVATLANGTLGFEWDIDADNGFRPAGLIDLSTATYSIPNLFLLDYGSTYGSGTATHHLTLYRAPSGALVFGAGTIQWSWGLDSTHDTPNFGAFPPDPNMQQAMVNLFADMGVQPATLQGGLIQASQSTDSTPPSSTIASPTSGSTVSAGSAVVISGTATDAGGLVGGVEISFDGGVSWHPATGRGSWSYTWTPSVLGSATIKSRATDDSGNIETPGGGVTVTVGARTCPCNLFGNATPNLVESNDTNSVELGMRFRSDVNAFVTGVRFYKGPTNTGTHLGHLWTNDGTLLASATFTGESGSGWQQVTFSSAIAISAGTTYVASYFAPNGDYSVDDLYFATSGIDSPPLHALQDGVDGANGIFSYSTTTIFPTSTFRSRNYWVDVILSTNVGGTGPTVTATSPVPGAAGVSPATKVTATFNKALDATTVTSTTFRLLDPLNNVVPASVTYNSTTFTATLSPTTPLTLVSNYTAVITGGSSGIKDTSGNALGSNVSWIFTTCCSVWNPSAAPGTADSGDGTSVEVGFRFRSDVDGFITAIRFYKSAANVGTHLGHLWTNTGTILGSATFTGETASGWQQAVFPSPVAVSAGTTYLGSYFAPSGHYSVDEGYFASVGVDNPPLHALKDGLDGANGVFTYGATSVFPTSTFQSSNYWVDVVLNPISLSTLTLNPTTVLGGNTSTGTVTLSGPAPTGGAIVVLGSDNSAAQVPASVTVAGGATTALFTVTTTSITAAATAHISGTYSTTRSAALTINPSGLASVTLNPGTLIGGNPSTGTVNLNGTAPAGGATVTLSSSNSTVAQVPPSVTVSAGATSATFTVTTAVVASTTSVLISGTYGATQSATLTVDPVPSQGQLAIDTFVSTDRATPATAVTSAAFSTLVPNELLLAFISADSASTGGVTVSSVTGGGLTWSLVKRTNAQPGGAEIWRAFAPAALSNATVTANLSQNVVSSITVVTFTGADATGTGGSGAIGATGGGSSAGGAPTASLVTSRNNSWVFGVGTDWDNATARTLGSNQTMVHQFLTNVGSTYWVQRQNSVSPLSGTTVTINDTAPAGDKYDLSIVEILPATVGPPDFSFSATPASQTVLQGSSTTYTVNVGALSGFAGTVTLGVSGLPTGVTGTFNPTTITGSGSSTLTVTTLGTTPSGTSTLTISGVSGSLNHSKTVSMVVATPPPPGQLAIDAITSTDRTTPAASVTSSAFSTLVPNELLLAFISSDSAVSGGLTVSGVTGAGLTWTLVKRTNTQPGGAEIWRAFATTTLSGVTVTANLSQTVLSSMTVVTFAGADATGTGGSGAIGATGGGSSAAGAPTASLLTTRNNSWVFGVGTDWDNAVARTLGANQTMVHQFLSNAGSSFWVQRQNAMTPLAGTTVTINDTAPAGDKYDLSIVEILSATVGPPDFSFSATPGSQTVLQGSSTTYTVNVGALSGFTGTVTLGVSGLPAGATGTFNPTTITGSGSSTLTVTTLATTPSGTSTLTISGVSGTLSHSTTASLVVAIPPPPGDLAIDKITSTDRTTPATSVTSAAFSTLVPNELLLAFISADSSSAGGLTVSSVTGAGLTWTLVKRTNAQPGGAEIWRAFASTALSNVTVTANLSQSVVSSITVVTFTGADATGTNGSGAIGATGGGSAAAGAPTASLVTTRNNSWVFGVGTDWDNATARTLGANQASVHQFLTPVGSTYWVQRQSSVTPLSGTAVTINDTAPSGDKYDLSIVEILPASLGPVDFSLSASPGSQTVLQGSSTTYTVGVGGSGGFSGTVTLGVSGLPANATGTFNPATITGSGSSTLTVTTAGTTPVGTSTLTISGVSGSLSHSTTVSLGVTTPPPPGQLAIDTFTSTDRTSAATSVTSPAFSTTVPNELLLAFVSADSASSGGLTVSSVTGGGLTWALVKRTNTQPGGAEIWRAFATTALSNATVTANLSQNVVSSITVVAFTGADATGTNGSGAIGATGGGSSAAGAPTASLITTRNNSWVFGVGTDWDNATARTLGANQTTVHQFLTNVGSTYWVQRQTSVTPLSGTTVTINDTAPATDKFDLSIVEILPASL